ncbi:E3 ubiquitin-protein ligase RDUF2 [Linum grandiflorum]
MPAAATDDDRSVNDDAPTGEDEAVGLTIWRLPGGGYAVGRFTGAMRGERELPVVYTEMDGGFNNHNGGLPRRVSWGSRGSRTRRDNSSGGGGEGQGRRMFGLGRVFRHWFGCFGSDSRRSISSSRASSSTVTTSWARRDR